MHEAEGCNSFYAPMVRRILRADAMSNILTDYISYCKSLIWLKTFEASLANHFAKAKAIWQHLAWKLL